MSSTQLAPGKRTRARKAEAPESASVVDHTETTAQQTHPLFVASIGVRWRDLDAFNHVNNSNYLTYLEEARLQWLRHVPGWFDEQSMPVLAASEINYRRPIEWPAQLHVQLICERLGNSSITLAHRIVDSDDDTQLYSDGKVVMVWMNPATGKPVPLPQSIRDAAGGVA
ncbi:thioesterase family protein [Dyella jiangningensis]|uniref:acyl-CoA thioesterase n=1 Tax=Dyella jiangningensis TaxID=1379159 RepID=UPI00240F8A96|nr:thioesterase family protein [Dyella jiangningensis]MDG2537537.1 thioesterase family protein [Dyella jiangningensis]